MMRKIAITSLYIFFACFSLLAQQREISLKDTITDPDIVIPAEIERNFDALLEEWSRNTKPSTLCKETSSQDAVYPDSVYINRLYSFPSIMELAYNPIVRTYIDMYSGRRRNQVAYMLARGDYYFPIFEHALDKYDLPLELKYLPVIESALKPTAVSPMGATGLWQFILGTGKMYDLEINSLVDERRDPLKATDAAARYLKDLYGIYGDWNLVIAAYNCGPRNVNKAIRRSNGRTDYWSIYPYLPRETRGYVPAFIAATYIMNYYKEHNICPMEYEFPSTLDTITVNKTVHFQQIADILNIPIEDIRTLNPQYKKDMVPGDYKPYYICLPSSKITDFISLSDTIYKHRTEELLAHRKTVEVEGYSNSASNGKLSTRKLVHKVRKGETLGSIARKHGVSSSQIKSWNRLRSNKLSVGRRLTINKPIYTKPSAKPTDQLAQNTESTTTSSSPATDSSSALANTDTESLIGNYLKNKQNHSNELGHESDITELKTENRGNRAYTENTRTVYHKVRIGETLTSIANRYDVEKEDIQKWNKISSSAVKVGVRLIIHIPEEKPSASNQQETSFAADTQEAQSVEVKPQQESTPKAKTTTKPEKPKKKKTVIYTVKKNDTLSGIASKYRRVTVADIKRANNLKSTKLSLGQKLKIPQK
ncbi:membrane-bound lytic murein transglycosylase D [Dysgonomonas sp. PH5-45]|nr:MULTISPECIES: LysM peptidoglycan-binding domain-containing protein [unclassified Dysgonomonas]MDH6355378.1 membrane-bound lytic murein transglycosylase D [Dysgonomonas sp. PH5-45]MDH6388276.1 membrane-bound lytic murein transglycosylase D [Dysgonomonas sp. PH5-37]